MSRSGSRYPSAYGHTPSYRSYKTSGYPSALSSSLSGAAGAGSSSLLTSDPALLHHTHHHYSDLDSYPSALNLGIGSNHQLTSKNSSSSMSSSKVQSYSTSYNSSSVDGGRPVVEYSTDSTYRASATGDSGIPRTSYAHTSSSYSSENPYKNRVSSYSYNI